MTFAGYTGPACIRPEKEEGIISKIRIKVVGCGGGGCNTITRLMKCGIKSAETIAVNTDLKHLEIVSAHKKVLIGRSITKGLGAGGFPELAMKCAEASKEDLRRVIGENEIVFIVAGMGGGTGTGAAPIIAKLAKEMGAIVVAFVTYPFALERSRLKKAEWGINQMRQYCDSVVVIDNNRLAAYASNLQMDEAFKLADDITANAIRGIADTIMFPSLMNIDYADVRAVMGNAGVAMISIGEGHGTDRVEKSVRAVLEHPLLDVDMKGAKGALIHIIGGPDLTLGEATKIAEGISAELDDSAAVKVGARIMPGKEGHVMVMAIVTGVSSQFCAPQPKQEKQEHIVMEVEDIRF